MNKKQHCPYCCKRVNTRKKLFVFDDDDNEYWHYECAIAEREEFEVLVD